MKNVKASIDEDIHRFLTIYKAEKGEKTLSGALRSIISEAGYDINVRVSLKGPPQKRA